MSLSATELPSFSEENSQESGEEGGETCQTPPAQCTGDLDPCSRGVGQPPLVLSGGGFISLSVWG